MKKNSPFQSRKFKHLIFSVISMVLMLAGMYPVMAQTPYTADDFRWEYSTDASTCENNGRIICLVINTVTGDTLNFVQGANPSDGGVCEMPDGTRFKLGSFQFRVEGSTEDFMSSPTSTTTASFAPGVYEVKWSAQMYNVGELVPVPIGVSTTTLVEVQNAYLPSTLNLVGQAIAENSEMYGGRPSLPGQNTGRIQFQVSNPNFPLHFVITDSQNDIVLDKVLNGPMYSGTDAHRYDFATYYTFDSLAVGSYSLLLEDGCQKTNPKYAFDIRAVRAPMLTDIYFGSGAPNYTDSNIVHFYSALLSVDADVWDYLENDYQEYLQYRVCYGDIDTSDWKPFPIIFDQLTRNSDYSYYVNYDIYDTAHNMSSYCPLYGKYLTFQYRCTLPGQTDTITRYTQILEKYWAAIETYDSVRYNQNEVVYDACSYRIPSVHEYTAKNRYSYTGSWNEYMTSSIPYSSTTTAAFFTGPFTWQMIDTLTHETVKTQRTNYYWDSWEIRKSDMEALYGSISDTTITFPVKIVVTDAKNCPVITYPNVTMYDRTRSAEAYRGVGCSYSQWIDEYSTGYDMYRCCQAPTGIRIYEEISNSAFGNNESGLLAMPDPNRFKYMRDGMKIKVTRSPYENKYNFTATYSFDRNEWDVEWENEDHGDVVTSVYEQNYQWGYYFGITVEENCFPYGDYEWSFLTACDTVNSSYSYYYGKEVIERTEDLSFTAEQNCMEMYIQLTGGQFSRVKLGADVNDPMQADEVWLDNPHELNTYVKVLGDSTGHDNRDYRVSDHPTIRLTKPGTYTLRMYTLDTSLYCRTDYFDTIITYESGVLYYEQNPTAFVCDAGGNTKGFVFCKAAGGMAPYTYTLYNANNELLGTNQTGEFLNLPDVHQNDHLTLYVSDVCGWNSTDSSIVMRDFKSSIVVWYNDESGDHQTSGPSATLKAVTKCEGTEITVNVSSINNLFNYRWYNKSGTFNVLTSEATVLIPRDAEADTYYVNVDFTECSAGFTDSIFVDVIRVPEVTITPTSPTVCPGGEVQLTFTPTNPNGSPTGEYVIGHENNSIVTFINYSDLQTHEFSYTATSPNRFWVHSVSDSICTYIIPEDTVLISLREMTSSCDVTVNSDTVCYGGDVTFTATSPTLGSAYTVKWYDTPTQDNLLDEKYIATSGETATFTLSGLTADTAVYVTVMDELHCETHSGTVQRYLNMGDSIAVHMSCGENVRLFDSGGSAQYYGPGEKDTITFSSADPTDRITLSFNSFDLVGSDKLYVYSGPIVHTDSLIATLSGSTIPSDISSNSSALTLRFRSDLTDQAEGWDAVVGCSATPAEARVHVLDSVDVSLTVSPELPARYGHSIDITATAHGGRSTNYQYVWQESTDNQTWNDLTGAPIIDGLSNTYSYAALNQSTYVRVIVTDASSTPCSGPGSAVLYLEVANIALSLTLTSDVTSICQETFAMSANVKNEGGETATGVSVRLNLPAGMVYGNPADTVIVIGDVDAGETVSKTFNVHNEIYVNTNTTKNIQAQIWSCDQGDGESVFQNWDWTRTPLENDEAEYQVTIHPSMDAMSTSGVSVDPVSVCYGQDATLTATPTISNPNIIWYADAALTEVVSTTNTYVAQQITEPRTYYVLAYNNEYCPSAAIVNHEIKLQYAVTDTLLMHNGTVQVGNNDHIRFYDDGGPEGNCTATSYTLLFTSADGSPLEIYFEGYQYFNTSALAIYDGNSVMGTNLTTNTQITDGSAFTASSGMMLVKFSSYDEYHNGFSAHVFTITRPAVAEAVASSRIGDAQTITPTDAIVCYSEDATLYATSTVAAPQTFIWYASDLFTVVHTEPIDHAGDPSTYTVPEPQREETYYVTVVGDGGCPLVPQIHNNYREVLLNDNWQTTTLAASDSVCLYDAGGKDGDYTANCNEHNRYFSGPSGSKIRLHISNLQMGDGYLQVFWHNANGSEESQILYGTQGERQDFESVDNWMRVLFYTGCDYGTYPGLDAYVYAVMPQDSNNFAKARIKFKSPSFTEVNVIGSGAYCYGTQATLEASVENNTDELRYAWYDKNYNLLSVNSGVTDTYQPTITSATTYYVNASAMGQCPTLPPGYVTVLMNEASNGEVRTFAEGEAVHFYDEGGPDGNYSTYNNNNGGWTYTFKAPAGKRVRMDLYNFQGSGNENLSIYDGTPSSHQSSWGYCCNYENLNATFYAESGTMTVRWQNYTSSLYPEQIGWDALVGVENGMGHMSVHEVTMASANVTVKAPISPSKITTEGLTACYGTEGYLTASAPSLTGSDLTFTWYGPDLIDPIHTETVSEGGTSQLPRQVLRNETYYVSVSNAENCAVTGNIHNNYREILLNNGETISLAAEDSVCIYDIGGKNGDYTADGRGYYNYFNGPTGSKIRLHISSLQMDGNNDGSVRVSWHDANGDEVSQLLYGTQGERQDFESSDNWMEVFFSAGYSGNSYSGLDAYLYAKTPHSDTLFAPANVTVKAPISPSNITTEGLTGCYGTEGYLTASAPSLTGSDLTFTWYGPDLIDPIHTETVSEGGTSQLPRQVLRNETYYVSVSNAENCAVPEVIHYNYREVLMGVGNEDVNLAAEDSVCLYDRGGKDGDYTASCTEDFKYFNGPTGSKIYLHITSLQMDGNGNGYVEVSWHDANGNMDSRTLYGTQGEQQDFESADNFMRVRFNTGCDNNSYPGLDAYVYANKTPHSDTSFAAANVTVKAPISPSKITTEGLTACYGTEGYLQASAPSLTGSDLTFTWYGPDLIEPIHTETVSEGGTSQLPRQVLRNETYYVSVSNAENCAVRGNIHNNYREMLLNNWEEVNLAAEDSVCLYDMGGKDGDYTIGCNGYYKSFYGPSGSKIHLHISNLQLDDNYDAHVYVSWHGANGNEESLTLYGTQSDLDFESEDNWMYVSFNTGCNSSPYPGLDAYVYAMTPHSDTLFAPANVTVKAPISPSNITTEGLTACYGTEGYLTASAQGLAGDLTFKWYGPDLVEPIRTETVSGGTSQLPMQVLRNETYYVSVSNAENCAVMENIHNNHREVLLTGGSTSLAAEDSVCLYDIGGKDGYYTANSKEYTRTFRGPSGSKVHLHISTLQMDDNHQGYVQVSWHDANGNSRHQWLRGTQSEWDFESEDNWMEVRFSTGWDGNSYPGLDAYVYVKAQHSDTMFASANVTVKGPISPSNITTEGLTACYNSEDYLQASAPDLTGSDLTFTWYGPDLVEPIHTETVSEGGTSQLPVHVLRNETYYVTVSNAENCAVTGNLHNNYREVLLNTNGDISLAAEDSVCLYDIGGKEDNYTADSRSYSYYFYGPTGSKIRLHISSLQLDDNHKGYVQVYWYDANGNFMSRELYGTQGEQDFVSEYYSYMHVTFYHGDNGNSYPGLDAYVYVMTPHSDTLFAPASVTVKEPSSPSNIITEGLTACYGTNGYLTASAPSLTGSDLTFKWYGPDLIEPIHTETVPEGGTSQLPVQVLRNETYYVSVSNAENCEVMEAIRVNHREVLLNNWETTNLAAEDSVCLYDMGGKDGDYTANCKEYSRDFRAPSGSKIHLHISNMQIADGGRVEVSWHNANGTTESQTLHGTQSDLDFESADNWMYVYFYHGCGDNTYPGLDAYVYAKVPHDATDFAPATVSVKTANPSGINTQNAVVCYGEDAVLTATTELGMNPVFRWYAPDLITMVKEEAGQSSTYTVPSPETQETYYVTMTNDTMCPFVTQIHDNYREFLFGGTNGGDRSVGINDSVCLYDAGGKDGDCEANGNEPSGYTFIGPEGSRLRLHVNSMDGQPGNGRLEVRFYDDMNYEHSSNIVCEDGTITDTNLVSMNNKMYVKYYPGSNHNTYSGLDAYLYVLSPIDTSNYAKAQVTFQTPVFTSVNVTGSGEYCYGNSANLTASVDGNSDALHYVWYDKGYNVVKQDTDVSSTYNPQVMDSATYYVNASAIGQCPVLPPGYVTVLMNEASNGKVRTFEEGEAVHFYDEGGPDGNYSTYNDNNGGWTYTFKAPAGKWVKMNLYNFQGSCNEYLTIYDGTLSSYQSSWDYNCNYENLNATFYAESGTMTVRWRNYTSSQYPEQIGWDALVGVEDGMGQMNVHEVTMGSAKVKVKAFGSSESIVTENLIGCYGTEGYLKASAPSLTGDLTFKWYDSDLLEPIYRETVPEGGTSRLPVQVLGEETYYVSVFNAENCEVREMIHNNYREVLMGLGSDVNLAAEDSVCLYDMGGKNGNYTTNCSGYFKYFYGPSGSKIRLHISSLQMDDNNNGRVRVRWHNANGNDESRELYGTQSDLNFESADNWMEVYFHTGDCNGNTYPGLDAYVYAMTPHSAALFASAQVDVKPLSPSLVNIQNDAVCYGQDAELKASSTIAADQYFVWFEPDRITAHYDTVHTIGAQSTLTVPSPQEECTYYVTVSNDTTCPFVGNIYSNEDTILFDENNSGAEINVDETLFHIYDDGGPVGNYGRDVSSYKYFYTSVDGAKIKVHFDTIALANDDARVYIYKTDNSWEQVFDVRGPKYISDTDIVVDGRRIEISFYNDSPSTAGGFAGTVSTIVPHRMSDLIPVPITFAAPEISSNVVVSDTLACYGVPIALRASITGNSSDMHYVWYNEDMRLMHEEVGVTSTYPRLATANERFFVNAVASGQCAIFPPNYNTVLLNESTSGDSYTLAEGEIIPFYDEGGPNGNYSTYVPSENAWTYTFKAPSEKQVTVKVNRLSTSNVDFRVYDGTIDDNNGEYYCYDGETYTSTTGMMTFRCYTYTPVYPDEGWDIQISVPDNNDEVHRTAGGMSYGTVSIIQQTSSPDRINTQDAEVCFGSPVTLTASASASEAAFPQIYTWYNPERTEVLLRDTLFAAGQSDFTVIPEQEETYWIALSGDGECPIVEAIHDRYENDIWFTYDNGGNNEKRLTETNIYRIYDDGGPNGDYYHEGSYFYANRSFRANIANSKIKVHFDTIALASSDVELSVRDQQNDNTVFKIRGPKYMGDTSILVNATSISIYFNNDESTWAAGGFAGYVHAITPHNEDELKEVHVTFAQPTINSTISVNDGEACFGDEVELVATSTSIPSPQVFAWFDEDYNFLESDTVSDGQSTFSSPVLSNTTYYVNATEQGDCPVLPPGYGSIMLNASTSGQSYTLAEGEAVPFYDEGGPNGNYSTYVPYENAWTYTFMAPAEKQVTVKVNGMNRNDAELLVYDGIVEDNNGEYYCYDGETYTSTTGKMTFRWHTENPVYPSGGWDILVGVKDVNDQMTIRDFGLASANVTVKQPTLGLDLLVTNDTVCYGSEAYLTAKATAETQSLLGYPQYFTWYAPNGRAILLKDTVDGINKTQSELTAPYYYQRQDQNYYVTVGNHDNCPVVLAPVSNVFDVHLNSSVHNQTTVLNPSDAAMFYDFYDAEGYYYQDHNSDYTHTFQTLQGNLRVKFYAMDKGGIEEGDTLYIYDASTADENAIIGKVSYMEDEDDYGTLSFVSTGKYLTFRFESEGSDEGWEALIMPVNMQAEMDTAQVFVQVTSVSDADITVMPDMICMGQTAEVSASANISYPQYYVWYDANMEVRKRDTLRDAAESPSMLPLPAHFVDASYYALVYSDTVSCMMNTSRMERIYSELPLTEFMSGFETQVSPTDSIRVFTPNVIEAEEREAFHYYFTADTGLIQIHFNELMMEGSDIGMEFIDEGIDDEYAEYEDGTYYDLTVTSLNNRMHLAVYRKPGDIFSFDATVTNIGAVNDNILSKLAQADVTIKMNNSTEFVTTINDTVCYGSPALLTASAPSLGYPQYYTWYNNDMSQILYKDTIESGVSNYYVTDNMGRATYLVNVENDTTCPIYESTVHPNIREYSMLPSLHMQNLFVGLADSIVVYDEGGKDGDYSVDDRHGVAVILETYPGATFNIRVPTFVLDPDGEAVLAIFEYDEDFDGDEPDLYFYETQTSEVVYNSFNNRIVLYWQVEDEGDPAQGFEVSVTAQTHPEKNLAKAKVELNTLPYMNTLALTADPTETTICQGDDVALTATSTLPDQPQYFVWYNSDFTSVLAADTVQSGNEGHANIANLTQDTLVYVSVGTDEICPAYPMDHKFNVQELYLTAPVSGDTTILTLVDSVLFYDEGGPDENYHSEEVRWMQTFTAANPNAHVKIYFKYIDLNNRDCREDNWLAVVQGPIDFEDLMNNDFLHEPFVGEDGPLFTDIDTMTSTGNSLTVVWQSKCYKGHASMGWEAYVYTDEPTNVGMDAFAVTKVNVNPSYRYTTYDSVCASATLYDVDRFQGIDISVPGDYTIDSVYHTSLGCDSIYSLQLHVHSNPVVGDDALVTPVACNGGSTGIIDMSSATVTGGEAPFTYTLFQNGTQMASFSDLPVGTYKVIAKDVHGCYSDSVTIDITEPDTLHLVSCPTATEPYHIPTGESYVTVEFEDPTFAPTLNNARITERQGKTANNQYGEGTHTITYIIQNDCGEEETCSVTFTVEDFDPLAVTLTVDSVTCYGKNNGAATVAITGGKPGSPRYTYTVTGVNTGYTNNNTTDDNIILSDLAPDRYTVHIEDMQGTPIDTAFNIGQPDTMVVIVTAPSVSCPNATSYEVSLTTTGGNGLNQYEWGVDATNANATSTVVERVLASDCGHEYKAAAKVTDRKGCVATDTVSFVFEDLVKPNATMPADTTLCRNALTGAMEAPTSVTGEPTNLSDNCTSVGNLTVYSIDTDTTGTDREPRVIHREWHVKDGCNNDSIKVQNITIRPSVLTENNITFTCPDMTITLKYGACDTTLELDRTLINNMTDMTVTLDSTGVPYNRRYNAENSPYTITWKVTDECGGYVEYTQNVTVLLPPCGPGVTAIDGDGIAYPTIRVGCNCWTARNARSTRYTDGTPITPAPMQYPGTEQHPEDTIYCKLYTYNAATRIAPPSISPVRSMPAGLAPAGVAPTRSVPPAQVQGICPDGWHIPDDEDFADLMAHWEGEELNAVEHWLTPGTNISGFTMEPGGCYNAELNRYEYLLVRGYLWSYTPGSTVVHACEFGSACGTVEFSPATMETGYSVRCVHNAE